MSPRRRQQLSAELGPGPLSLVSGLTRLEERRYVAGVLRRLLGSFPGAHGCHSPNLELSVSRAGPPEKSTKRRPEITAVPAEASSETHGRLRRLAGASGAICRPPSCGNEIGGKNDQPGAPGSSSEWSREERSCSAQEEAEEAEEEEGGGRGRVAVR